MDEKIIEIINNNLQDAKFEKNSIRQIIKNAKAGKDDIEDEAISSLFMDKEQLEFAIEEEEDEKRKQKYNTNLQKIIKKINQWKEERQAEVKEKDNEIRRYNREIKIIEEYRVEKNIYEEATKLIKEQIESLQIRKKEAEKELEKFAIGKNVFSKNKKVAAIDFEDEILEIDKNIADLNNEINKASKIYEKIENKYIKIANKYGYEVESKISKKKEEIAKDENSNKYINEIPKKIKKKNIKYCKEQEIEEKIEESKLKVEPEIEETVKEIEKQELKLEPKEEKLVEKTEKNEQEPEVLENDENRTTKKTSFVTIYNYDGDDNDIISMEDVDNMIKALEKKNETKSEPVIEMEKIELEKESQPEIEEVLEEVKEQELEPKIEEKEIAEEPEETIQEPEAEIEENIEEPELELESKQMIKEFEIDIKEKNTEEPELDLEEKQMIEEFEIDIKEKNIEEQKLELEELIRKELDKNEEEKIEEQELQKEVAEQINEKIPKIEDVYKVIEQPITKFEKIYGKIENPDIETKKPFEINGIQTKKVDIKDNKYDIKKTFETDNKDCTKIVLGNRGIVIYEGNPYEISPQALRTGMMLNEKRDKNEIKIDDINKYFSEDVAKAINCFMNEKEDGTYIDYIALCAIGKSILPEKEKTKLIESYFKNANISFKLQQNNPSNEERQTNIEVIYDMNNLSKVDFFKTLISYDSLDNNLSIDEKINLKNEAKLAEKNGMGKTVGVLKKGRKAKLLEAFGKNLLPETRDLIVADRKFNNKYENKPEYYQIINDNKDEIKNNYVNNNTELNNSNLYNNYD